MSGFATLLARTERLTEADLSRAEIVREQTNAGLAATLVRLGLVDEGEAADAMAEATGYARFERTDLVGAADDVQQFNPRFLIKRAILPLAEDRLAMADAEDVEARAAAEFALGRILQPVVASFGDIAEVLRDLVDIPIVAQEGPLSGLDDDIERMLEGQSEAPIIRTVQRLLEAAVNRRASDVHIEPMTRQLIVRYRIDGKLVEAERLPVSLAAAIASRVKVMASLDIAESRLPQDGRLRLTVRGRDVDVRVSTSPTAWGESIVLRLLGKTEVPLDLDLLGLPKAALATLNRALARPHGIILLTGPTGSGKTTTLYAALSRLRRPDVKILTVEDPVEVMLDGVNQVQVRPEIDLTYAATLRAFLRQDPDILMIGEIRDQETAEIALRAALTGHLVLSTLHTNSALGAFTRLRDIGVEPYLIASTVLITIAQRLIRSLCSDCSYSRAPTTDEAALFFSLDQAAPETVSEPVGCQRCGNSGFRGRVPLIDIVEVDDRLRESIRNDRIPEPPATGLLTHGLALAAAGRTSLSEVRRAVALQ